MTIASLTRTISVPRKDLVKWQSKTTANMSATFGRTRRAVKIGRKTSDTSLRTKSASLRAIGQFSAKKSGAGKQLELTLVAFRHSWVLDVLVDLSAYASSHKLMASADALLDAIEVTMSSLWADPEDTCD